MEVNKEGDDRNGFLIDCMFGIWRRSSLGRTATLQNQSNFSVVSSQKSWSAWICSIDILQSMKVHSEKNSGLHG